MQSHRENRFLMTCCFQGLVMGTAMIMVSVLDASAEDEPHATSSYMAAAISSVLPKFDPTPLAAAASKASTTPGKPTPGVTLMKAYVVRDVKIPTDEVIMTPKARAKVAMDKYLGPSDGLDRGLLNAVTLTQLWKKIPIIGGLDFVGTEKAMSYADRAYDAGGANDTIPYPHPPPAVKN
jgi:hypothetical protein